MHEPVIFHLHWVLRGKLPDIKAMSSESPEVELVPCATSSSQTVTLF